MRTEAIDTAAAQARASLLRFPLALTCGLVAFAAGWNLVGADDARIHALLIATSLLGIPLFVALHLIDHGCGPQRREAHVGAVTFDEHSWRTIFGE